MGDVHNYTFFFDKEMPWKKDISNYVYPDGRLCYDCNFSHTVEEHMNIWPNPDIEDWEEEEDSGDSIEEPGESETEEAR